MACSVAPALPHQMFHGAGGAAPHQMMRSKARHRRTGAVVFALEMSYDAADPGTEAEVLRPVVPDSESFSIPLPVEDEAAQPVEAANKTKKRRWGGDIKRKILASARRANVVLGKKQRAPPPEQQATTVGALEAYAAARIRERKGFKAAHESLARSGPEMTAAFLAYVIASGADAGSDTPIDHELVARWAKRKEACLRRARYLRDCCPFQREEGEEREPDTTTTLPPAEPDHA